MKDGIDTAFTIYDDDNGYPGDVSVCSISPEDLTESLAYIERLEEKYKRAMDNAKILSDAVTRLERERDAAIREIPRECNTCKHFESCGKEDGCRFCSPTVDEECPCCDCVHVCNWEWCGLLEV